MLRAPSPQVLKKYGVYAVLSFFMSLSIMLGTDDIRVRDTDTKYERVRNESLQHELDRQVLLKNEQDSLLREITIVKIDKTKHVIHEKGH